MFKMKRLKHLIFWVLLTIYACIIDPGHGTIYIQTVEVALIMFSYMFIYYTESILIFPIFYKKRKFLSLALFLTFMVFHIISYINFQVFMESHKVVTTSSGQSFMGIIISEIIIFGITSTMALGAYQNKVLVDKIKTQSEKETSLLISEFSFLKNQFNSHITFNFLNYCYNRIYKESSETAEAIEIFSRMMRYSLNNKIEEKVQLQKEIEYIEDFIELQKLLSTEVNVQFLINDQGHNSMYVIPRILITFVENAFKHGNLHSIENPITIELNYSTESINFKVTNEKNKHKINEPSGIGHYNLKQQLELLYKNKYTLKIEDKGNTYSSELKLILN
jgi:two-component system LytT family sensor kinase